MNFDLSEEQKALIRKIEYLFDPETEDPVKPLERTDPHEARGAVLKALGKLAQAGYLAAGVYDGKNSPFLVAAQEALAARSPSLFLSVEMSARVFARLVAIYSTRRQQEEILPDLMDGDTVGCVALTEAGMSLEKNPLQTLGTRDGNAFRLSGTKAQVINAPIADWIAVAGNTVEGESKAHGFFLVKGQNRGLSIGQRLNTMGYQGAPISAISIKDCSVPLQRLIGPFKEKEPIRALRKWEDQVLTSASLGLIRRSYDTALKHAKEHVSGGKPIIAYQEIGFKLAEMLTLFQTAQLLAYRAAWMDEVEDREADVLRHCAKVFCSESAQQVASEALQILGAKGFTATNPAEESYRDAKYLQIGGTSSEISRMKIGEGVLERGS